MLNSIPKLTSDSNSIEGPGVIHLKGTCQGKKENRILGAR